MAHDAVMYREIYCLLIHYVLRQCADLEILTFNTEYLFSSRLFITAPKQSDQTYSGSRVLFSYHHL